MTFQIIFEQNCENTAANMLETRTKVDFLFERNLSKKASRKIGSNVKEKPTF